MTEESTLKDPGSAPTAPFDAKSFVESLPGRPGVYRMLDADGEIVDEFVRVQRQLWT